MAKKIDSQLGRDYLWNTASSIIGSASMVIMALVVSRFLGGYAAGVFTLATAAGQQFQTLGAYEVRPYQATDVRHRFSFPTYFAARLITVALMVVGIVGTTLWSGRPASDMIAFLIIASLRLFDAFEDVFYGEFQRLGRLDIAGKANFFRVLVTLASFLVALLVTHDLLLTSLVTFVLSFIAMVALILPAARTMLPLRPSFAWKPLRRLLLECFPLFLAAFLAMYLNNAPRYAVESNVPLLQGEYGILFMPALAINILAMFIFRPLLTRMATHWTENDHAGFLRLMLRGLQSAVGAFILTFIATLVAGIPILEVFSGLDLAEFKGALLVLVAGGAFNAVSIILYYALTTMRLQRVVLIGYAIVAVMALVLSQVLVSHLGIMGAALAYASTMLVLSLIFGAALAYFIRRVPADTDQ
ncbi:MAG: lipopolysaccharide biosynthesis protein [Ancrocorticia sp.]